MYLSCEFHTLKYIILFFKHFEIFRIFRLIVPIELPILMNLNSLLYRMVIV